MALSRIQTAEIADNAITTSKVADATVIGTDIVDGTIVDSMVASGAAIAHTKCAVGTVAGLDVGTGANQILQLDGSGNLPVLDGTQLTGIVSDFTPIENQLSRLGLHIGAVEQLAKFNMIDQVIDDYEDATGVDASASTNETLAGSAGVKYYSGSSNSNQTLISTTTTAESTPTKASIVLQTEDELGTATINTDVKAGVSRDALNYVDTTLAKIGTWGSGNVYAANDVTMPGTVMTKDVTIRAAQSAVGAYQDHSSSAHALTANGGAALSTVEKKFGTHSMLFDGSNDGMAITDHADFDFGTNDFTFEAWIYCTEAPGSFDDVIFGSGAWGGPNYDYTFDLTPTGAVRLELYNGSSTYDKITAFNVISQNTWHHVAVSRSSGSIKIFVDGTEPSYSTDTASNQNLQSNGSNPWIGRQGRGAYFKGYIDEVRISNNARYTANFTPSTTAFTSDSNTKLLIHGETQSALSTAFKVDGTAQAIQTLTEGYTYKFDTSNSDISGHTFKFATAADAAGSTEYTTGVTESGTPGSANAYTQIVVAASAPTLYYYCSNHASMGGTANTPAEAATTSMRYKVETKNQSYTAATAPSTFSALSPTVSYSGNFGWQWNNSAGAFTQLTDNNHESGRGTATTALNGYLKWDMGQNYIFNSGTLRIGTYRGAGDHMQYTITYSTDDSTYSAWDMSGISQDSILYSNNISNVSSGTAAGEINFAGHSASGGSISLISGVSTVTARYIKVTLTAANLSGSGYDANGKITNFDPGTVVIGTGNLSATGKVTRIHGTSLAWK